MANDYLVGKTDSTIIKFLRDPEVDSELKDICFKLLENPFIESLLEKTPIQVIFEICEEYMKHPIWYDDIFNGEIKIFLNGLTDEALPIFKYIGIQGNCDLKMFFGPNTLIGEIIEKFIACDALNNKIRRITIQIKDSKLLTAGLNSENTVKAMIVDFIDIVAEEDNPIIKLLKIAPHKRIDLIRV